MELSEGTMASAAKARSLHEATSPYEQAQQPSSPYEQAQQPSQVDINCQHLWVLRSILCIELDFPF